MTVLLDGDGHMDGDPPMYDNHSMDTVTLLGIKAGVATFVQGTVVQGDFGLRRLLSLPVISLLKSFFYSLLDVTILNDYKMTTK